MRQWVVAAFTAAVGLAMSSAAEAAAPVIVNNSGGAHWREAHGLNDDVRQVNTTFVVRHDPSRRITGVAVDENYNGTDDTPGVAPDGITAQYLGTSGDSSGTNKLASSVVRFQTAPPRPGGFSCPTNPFSGATRRVNAPIRFKVVDDLGQRSGTVAQDLRFIERNDCGGRTDYAVLESWGQSAQTATPGQNVTFSFTCDDDDSSGSNDRCDRIYTRYRRLNDGATSGLTERDAEDNTNRSFSQSFPDRGVYVVEAKLCGESDSGSSCEDDAFWRIGSVFVNDTTAPSLTLSGVTAVNPGTPVTVTASVGDSGLFGSPQVIEWDADGDSAFERTEYTTPFLSGTAVAHSAVSGDQLTQSVGTATPGLKTVRARVYDNGAIDAADHERNVRTVTHQVRVNALPTAALMSRTTNEDTPATFALAGDDADGQPSPLSYEIVDQPSEGAVTVTPGGSATYAPPPNFHGSTSFTYRVSDGLGTSAAATVDLTVTPVNDVPMAADSSVTTAEDAPVAVELVATDIESGGSLTYAAAQPSHGEVSCSGTSCTYTPDANFHGTDSFTWTATDPDGGSDTGTVSITVTSVNDAPVAGDASVSALEDIGAVFGLPVSDADGETPAIAILDGPHNGTVDCSSGACTYTPAADFHGTDGFTYRATDGAGASGDGAVSITVASVNDAPVAADQSLTTAEDTPVTTTLAASDVEGDELSFTAGAPANGTVDCDDADCTFTPAPDFHGTGSFGFTVSDGNGGEDAGTVEIAVTPVNDAPVAQDAALEVDEDTPGTVAVTATDADGDDLEATAGTAAHGTVECTGLACEYTPEPNFHGTDGFDVTVADGEGGTGTAQVAVTVRSVNDAPSAAEQTVTTPEDEDVDLTLVGVDVDGDALSYAVTGGPDHGTVDCDADECEYVPAADFNGTDTFEFAVSDGHGGTDTGTVELVVTPVNDAPVATDQTLSTDEDTELEVTLAATDIDGDTSLVFAPNQPAHGDVDCDGAACTYTPDPNFHGSDAFSFLVVDGNGGGDSGTVSITVHPVNDAPSAADQAVTTAEDTPVELELVATDVDGDDLTYAAGQAEHGTVECDGDACTYTPEADFHGTDEFAFTVSDGHEEGGTDSATVSITVTPVNDAPVAQDGTLTTDEDTPGQVTLQATDVDGDELTYSAADGEHGTVTCDGADCTYTPEADFHGTDELEFTVSDAEGDGAATDTGTVAVTVAPVNDGPTAADATASTDEDTPVAIELPVGDVDGDELTATAVEDPQHGEVSCEATTCTYTPEADFHGEDAFRYEVADGEGATAQADVALTVRAVNDAPVAQDASATTDEDVFVDVTIEAADVDGDELTAALEGDQPEHGSVGCAGLVCRYVPDADFHGTDAFEVRVSDGDEGSDVAAVSVTVRPVNDAPVAQDVPAATDEDTPVDVELAATDVDGDELSYAISRQPAAGTVSCEGTACRYTPDANVHGTESFAFVADDGHGGTDEGEVTVTIAPVNDAPVAGDLDAATEEDQPVELVLPASDVDGDVLAFGVTTQPEHGEVTCEDALCTYTPDSDFHGEDRFTFTVTDGSGAQDTGEVRIAVTSISFNTRLDVPATVRVSSLPLQVKINYQARLVRPDTGAPVPGKRVQFLVGGQPACAATTNADGVAQCAFSLSRVLGFLLGGGYDAVFAGDEDYEPSSGRGRLVG